MQHKVFILVVKGDYYSWRVFSEHAQPLRLGPISDSDIPDPLTWIFHFMSRRKYEQTFIKLDVAATDREGQAGKGWQSKCVRCAQRCTSTVWLPFSQWTGSWVQFRCSPFKCLSMNTCTLRTTAQQFCILTSRRALPSHPWSCLCPLQPT